MLQAQLMVAFTWIFSHMDPEHEAKACKKYWYKTVQVENVCASPVGKMLICLKDFSSFLRIPWDD